MKVGFQPIPGNIYDSDRLTYILRNGMMWQQRAVAEGIPITGAFVWSAMDNFEWINDYGDRFLMVHVDFRTQKRTPKLTSCLGNSSAHYPHRGHLLPEAAEIRRPWRSLDF